MKRQAVTIVIPTLRRPAALLRALESLLVQEGFEADGFEVIVVDNDPEASGLPVVHEVAGRAPPHIAMQAIAMPQPGVANARNAAMDRVNTRLVAFLDDDMTAPRHWLASLLDAHAACPAGVTFGPKHSVLPKEVTRHTAYLDRFFSLRPGHDDGRIDASYGCGNSLLDLDRTPPLDPLFNPATNESGGEDDMLYADIRAHGEGFAWCEAAFVHEHIPASRARLGYTLPRAFAYGQGPCTLARRQKPPQVGRLLMWMGIGAGQTLVYGTCAAVTFLLSHPSRAGWLDRTARGLGKVFWFHREDFYGEAMLKRSHAAAPGETVTARDTQA